MFERISKFVVGQLKTVTIEPLIFLQAVGITVVSGVQLTTKLLLEKICRWELGKDEDICNNLSTEDAIREEVQILANNFKMNSQWISTVPMVFFALIAGALSDEFGRKPLILFPMIGSMLSSILMLLNYAFIDVLPVEFFYLENVSSLFGGYAVYYLGIYSYVTNIAKPKDRAHRLARLDGVELIGATFGIFLSPIILENLGSFGSYGISVGIFAVAIVQFYFFVEESNEPKTKENGENQSSSNWMVKSFVTPFLGMKSLLFKKRKQILKVLILFQLMNFLIYWIVIEVGVMQYLYMFEVFAPDFTDQDFANYSMFNLANTTVNLLFVVPFLNTKLKLHDSMMLFIMVTSDITYNVAAPFCTVLWQFYFVTFIGSLGYSKYSVLRSLLSKSITLDEVGKVFSFLAVLAAIGPAIGNPIFRQLYNNTISTFPGAIFLLVAALLLLANFFNFFFYTQRHHLLEGGREEKEESTSTTGDSLEETKF